MIFSLFLKLKTRKELRLVRAEVSDLRQDFLFAVARQDDRKAGEVAKSLKARVTRQLQLELSR